MYKLDYSKAITLQLSNDAYHYMQFEEELLDDNNYEEVCEIMAMFPNGYIICNDVTYVENSDIIECQFIPYIDDEWVFDKYIDMYNNWQLQIKIIDTSTIKVRYYSPIKEPFGEEVCKIQYNSDGRPLICTKNNCIYPLWKAISKK